MLCSAINVDICISARITFLSPLDFIINSLVVGPIEILVAFFLCSAVFVWAIKSTLPDAAFSGFAHILQNAM